MTITQDVTAPQDASASVPVDGPASPRQVLDALEAESIHIIREVVAEFDRPAMLFSGGKDSVVMLHLAAKAFWPGRVPFPLLHVDTGHNFDEVLTFRDHTVQRLGLRLEVASVQDYIDSGDLVERADGTRNPLQTTPLWRPLPGTGSTLSSAADAGMRTRPAPRSASCPCAMSSASGTPATSGRNCGTCITGGIAPDTMCAPFPSATGPN